VLGDYLLQRFLIKCLPFLGRDTKHPEIHVAVEASGDDYRLVDHVIKAMRSAGLATAEIEEFCDEAMSGEDLDLLWICSRWVTLVPL
jgi:hypothetical protein